MAYDVDALFRGEAHAEAARILATGVQGDVSATDRATLAQLKEMTRLITEHVLPEVTRDV